MIAFWADNCPQIQFARTGRDFVISDNGETLIQLKREIGKKIWFALATQSFTSQFFSPNPRQRLSIWTVKNNAPRIPHIYFMGSSNCHGTAREVMNSHEPLSKPSLWWMSTFSKILGHEISISCMAAYVGGQKEKLPICIIDSSIHHSAVIIWYVPARGKYLIFEKVWYNHIFRLLLLDIKEMQEAWYTHFSLKV